MSRCKNNEFIQIKNTHRDAPRKTILTKILTFLEIATAQIADNMLNTPLVLLSYQDSNLDKQDQNLLCYRYTIRQYLFETAKIQKNVIIKNYFK